MSFNVEEDTHSFWGSRLARLEKAKRLRSPCTVELDSGIGSLSSSSVGKSSQASLGTLDFTYF